MPIKRVTPKGQKYEKADSAIKKRAKLFSNEEIKNLRSKTRFPSSVKKRGRGLGNKPVKMTGVTLFIGEQKKLDPDWKDKFFYELSRTGSIRKACEFAQVS